MTTLTFAGVRLVVPNQEIEDLVSKIPLRDLRLFDPRNLVTKGRLHLSLPPSQEIPGPQANRLFWPTGATRFSVGYFLTTDKGLNQIQNQSFSGGKPVPQNLVMDTGSGTLKASLYYLTSRPLSFQSGLVQKNGLHLIVLVDSRYFWWTTPVSSLTITPGTTTWANLLTTLATATGSTFVSDPINGAYLTPGSSLGSVYSQYDPVSILLEAVLFNVGQRLVADYGGVYETLNPWSSAAQRIIQNWEEFVPLLRYGGTFSGQLQTVPQSPPANNFSDLNGILPSQVQLIFPPVKNTTGEYLPPVVPVSTSLTGNLIQGFAQAQGNGTTQTFWDTAQATVAISGGTPSNLTDLQNLTTRFAQDWWAWKYLGIDGVFSGIVPWLPDGVHDLIFTWTKTEVSTRVQRRTVDESIQILHHGNATGKDLVYPWVSLQCLTFDPGTGDTSVAIQGGMTTLEVDQKTGLTLTDGGSGIAKLAAVDTSNTHAGVVNLTTQVMGSGVKVYDSWVGLGLSGADSAGALSTYYGSNYPYGGIGLTHFGTSWYSGPALESFASGGRFGHLYLSPSSTTNDGVARLILYGPSPSTTRYCVAATATSIFEGATGNIGAGLSVVGGIVTGIAGGSTVNLHNPTSMTFNGGLLTAATDATGVSGHCGGITATSGVVTAVYGGAVADATYGFPTSFDTHDGVISAVNIGPGNYVEAGKYTITGDGVTTSFTVTHNFGTEGVQVMIWAGTSVLLLPMAQYPWYNSALNVFTTASTTPGLAISTPSGSQVTIQFPAPPAFGQVYSVVVWGGLNIL